MASQLSFLFDAPEEAIGVKHATPSRAPAGRVDRHPRRARRSYSRYKATRRARALSRPFTGYGAYRLVMKGITGYVFGPEGRRCEELESWARSVLHDAPQLEAVPGARRTKTNHDPFAKTRRLMAAVDAVRVLLDAINWVYPTHPDILASLLHPKSAQPREMVRFWLVLRGCVLKRSRGQNKARIVFPASADEQWQISVTITRYRNLFDFWHEAGIRPGDNPMQMDKRRRRLAEGETRRNQKAGTRWWSDVDSLFRVRQIERQAPRPSDPATALRVLEWGREHGWPQEVLLKFEGQYLTGAREGQLDAATAFGLLVAAKDDRHIRLIQKGSDGSLAWDARTPPGWRARVLDMLDRKTRHLGGLDQLMKWARSNSAVHHEKLRRIFIFSPDLSAPTPRWRSAHMLRQAVEALDLHFDILRDDGTIVRKWFTSQWFRHIFVGRILDSVAASSLDQAGKDEARAKLARYMGWKQADAMLLYYGRAHFDAEADQLVADHQDDLNAGVSAEFADEEEFGAANDNALWARERVAGGDLLD